MGYCTEEHPAGVCPAHIRCGVVRVLSGEGQVCCGSDILIRISHSGPPTSDVAAPSGSHLAVDLLWYRVSADPVVPRWSVAVAGVDLFAGSGRVVYSGSSALWT